MAKKPDVTKLPSAKLLASLVSQSKSNASEIADLKGEMGQAIADAVSKHNLHAGAFKLVRKLQKMDAVKLLAFLTHLDDYRQKLELDKLAGESLDLDGAGDGESESDDERDGEETDEEMIARLGEERAARVKLAEETRRSQAN